MQQNLYLQDLLCCRPEYMNGARSSFSHRCIHVSCGALQARSAAASAEENTACKSLQEQDAPDSHKQYPIQVSRNIR